MCTDPEIIKLVGNFIVLGLTAIGGFAALGIVAWRMFK